MKGPRLVKGEKEVAVKLRMARTAKARATKTNLLLRAVAEQPLLREFVRALASVDPQDLSELLEKLQEVA